MSKKGRLEPSQLGRRRRRRRNFRILFLLIFLLLIFFGVVGVSYLSAMRISNIKVEGTSFASANNLVLRMKADLSGNYFYLFPKDNIFLFPEKAIKADLMVNNPSIIDIKISRQDLKTLNTTITERKPFALWCREEQDCFFLDNSGYIFYVAPSFSTDLYFIYHGSINTENPIGQQFLSPTLFNNINNFLDEVRKLNVNLVSLTAKLDNDFSLTLKEGGEIRFNTAHPLEETLSNLETIIDKNNPNGKSIDLNQIDYVDLRFGNKIFFKLKSGTTATSTL